MGLGSKTRTGRGPATSDTFRSASPGASCPPTSGSCAVATVAAGTSETLLALMGLRHRPRHLVLRGLHAFWRVPLVARELLETGETVHVHAHFAVSQTEAALGLAALLGCGFSFTAHARDIYATPNALEQKVRAARFVVTCTWYNVEYLRRLCPGLPPDRLHMIRHGVPGTPERPDAWPQ